MRTSGIQIHFEGRAADRTRFGVERREEMGRTAMVFDLNNCKNAVFGTSGWGGSVG